VFGKSVRTDVLRNYYHLFCFLNQIKAYFLLGGNHKLKDIDGAYGLVTMDTQNHNPEY